MVAAGPGTRVHRPEEEHGSAPPRAAALAERVGESVEAPASAGADGPTAALLAGAAALICLIGVLVPGDAQLDDDVLLVAAASAAVLGAPSCSS